MSYRETLMPETPLLESKAFAATGFSGESGILVFKIKL